jgi:RimJ/RimL family protein N-acetyltransferase
VTSESSRPAPTSAAPAAESAVAPGPRARALGLAFRPITEADLTFLAALYASTREAELAPVPWTAEEKRAFLRQQFEAQHRHYMTYYAGTDFLVIEKDGQAVGRLYLARWPAEHRIVDIALVPDWRGQGLGTAMLRDLCEEAAEAGKPLSIHVECYNPALRLYRRLGFRLVEDKGVYHLLEWRPGGAQVKTAS